MNHKPLLQGVFFIAILIILNSCSDSGDEPNPCINGPEISIDNVLNSIEGKTTGEITVSATSGTAPLTFSIDGKNFQSNGTFTNLSADDYTIIVKDDNDCTDSKMTTVDEIPEVFYANQIRPIIDINCQISPCHGSNTSIPTFATYDDVKAKAERIKVTTGNKSMPRNGFLSDNEINLIADWVDQGAPNN